MDFITLLDGIVVVVVLVSALLAMYRGFLREVLSIGAWAAAAIVAVLFYKQMLPTVKVYVPNDMVATITTIGGLFLVTLLFASWVTMKISDFVLDSAFGALDRTFGFIFGAARGLLLLVVAIQFFNGFVPAQQQPHWVAAAKSKPILDALGVKLLAALPENAEEILLKRFKPKAPADEGAPAEPGVAPGKTGEAPIYRNGEKKQLEQMIGSQGRTP